MKRWLLLPACLTLLAALCPPGAAAETVAYEIPFEKAMSWSGVMLPWGAGGYLDWTIAEGGKPGKALRITSALRRTPVTYEIRTLMFSHEPGATARISLDIKPVVHPAGSLFRVRWYDGYVTAEAFEMIADDAFEPFPAPIYERSDPPARPGWDRLDYTTPALERTVLTLAFMISQPEDTSKDEQDEFMDYLLDSLRVETVPLSHYMDPGLDWHGKGGAKMKDWRWTTGGAHVDWCDFMDEVDAPWPEGGVVPYTFVTFRDSGSRPLHVKHNYAHDIVNTKVGGASSIALVRIDPGDVPASWGIRQTVSYAALGLGPDDDAAIEVIGKYTFQQDTGNSRWARLQVGCDPRGGVVTDDALWSKEDPDVNWDDGYWHYGSLKFDRPKGAAAFTVFFRCRDGIVRPNGEVRATPGLGRAIADWIAVKATKRS